MLWYKSWLDTRWRFLIGLGLLVCSAGSIVMTYPTVMRLMPLVPSVDVGGELGRRIREAADLSREYRGYVWSQGIRQNLVQLGTLFAVLLGTGGMLSARHGALFTLSLPVSRQRLIAVRAATGLGELLTITVASLLVIPLLSPAVGESYSLGNVVVHGLCFFAASAAFFSLALLLSTVFDDLWRPLGLSLAIAVALAGLDMFLRDFSSSFVYGLMSGETYFRTGALPWAGLFTSAAASIAMLYGASLNLSQRDF